MISFQGILVKDDLFCCCATCAIYLEQGILVLPKHSDGYLAMNFLFICRMSDSLTLDGGKSAQAKFKRPSIVDT